MHRLEVLVTWLPFRTGCEISAPKSIRIMGLCTAGKENSALPHLILMKPCWQREASGFRLLGKVITWTPVLEVYERQSSWPTMIDVLVYDPLMQLVFHHTYAHPKGGKTQSLPPGPPLAPPVQTMVLIEGHPQPDFPNSILFLELSKPRRCHPYAGVMLFMTCH